VPRHAPIADAPLLDAHHPRPPTTARSKDCDLVVEAVFEDRKFRQRRSPKARRRCVRA